MKRSPIRNTYKVDSVSVNGEDVLVLAPDLNAGTKRVIVSESVLDYLIGLLPKGSLREVKETFVAEVQEAANMTEYVNIIRTELEFRESLSKLRLYYGIDEEVTAEPEIMGVDVRP